MIFGNEHSKHLQFFCGRSAVAHRPIAVRMGTLCSGFMFVMIPLGLLWGACKSCAACKFDVIMRTCDFTWFLLKK